MCWFPLTSSWENRMKEGSMQREGLASTVHRSTRGRKWRSARRGVLRQGGGGTLGVGAEGAGQSVGLVCGVLAWQELRDSLEASKRCGEGV